MRAHFVLAHPEPQSFNAHFVALRRRDPGRRRMDDSDVRSVRDGLRSLRAVEHYRDRPDPERFDVQSTQRRASEGGALPKRCLDEIAPSRRADLLVLQYPMWWHLPPAMMKGWFDRVLVYGEVYTAESVSSRPVRGQAGDAVGNVDEPRNLRIQRTRGDIE